MTEGQVCTHISGSSVEAPSTGVPEGLLGDCWCSASTPPTAELEACPGHGSPTAHRQAGLAWPQWNLM